MNYRDIRFRLLYDGRCLKRLLGLWEQGMREGSTCFVNLVREHPASAPFTNHNRHATPPAKTPTPFLGQALARWNKDPSGLTGWVARPTWKHKKRTLKLESFSFEGEDIF